MENTALLVIDMLNDFILPGAPLEVPRGRDIIPSIQEQIKKARSLKIPVIYVCDSHDPDDKEFSYWPPHSVKGSSGAKIVKELSPEPGDQIIEKKTLSAFFNTSLDEELKKRKIKNLILTGVCTNICVLFAAMEGMIRGYKIKIPEDCVAALSDEDHKMAMSQMVEKLKIAEMYK